MSVTDIVKALGLGLLLSVVLFFTGFFVGRHTKPKSGETGRIETCTPGEKSCEDSISLPF